MLRFMRLQRVGRYLATEQQQQGSQYFEMQVPRVFFHVCSVTHSVTIHRAPEVCQLSC